MQEPCSWKRNQTISWHVEESQIFTWGEKHSVTGSSGSGRITLPILREYFFYAEKTEKLQHEGRTIQVNLAVLCKVKVLWSFNLGTIKIDLKEMKHSLST